MQKYSVHVTYKALLTKQLKPKTDMKSSQRNYTETTKADVARAKPAILVASAHF